MAMLNTEVSSFIILYFSHKLYHCHISIQTHTSLLSLIPLSCIVALSSRLVNTLFPLNLNIIITPNIHNKDNMDIKIDIPRGKSDTDLPNTNSSKELLVLSNTFSTSYVKRIKAQSKDLSWADQVNKICASQSSLLSYVTLKERKNNI